MANAAVSVAPPIPVAQPMRVIGTEPLPATFRLDPNRDIIEMSTYHDLYKETKDLNSGASAVCVSAVHRLTGEKVALKVFKNGTDSIGRPKPYTKSCFLEEAEIALKCRGHPNVIWTSLPAYRTVSEGYVLVCEWGNGSDLLDFYNDERNLTQKDILGFLMQMAAGLQHVHDRGFVHMDVKPENFVVSTDPAGNRTIKLIDFGLAYPVGKVLPHRMSVCGGRVYYAPEKFPPSPGNQTTRTHYCVQPSFDVWGFGVTMLSCMTSRMPWGVAYDTDEGYKRFKQYIAEPQKLQRPPAPFSQLTEKWVQIYGRIFMEDLNERISMADLTEILSTESQFLRKRVKFARPESA
eukprot:scpid78845/ scgid25214/ Maternal embryonic leucine zipper kinase; Protein kinase Eg3